MPLNKFFKRRKFLLFKSQYQFCSVFIQIIDNADPKVPVHPTSKIFYSLLDYPFFKLYVFNYIHSASFSKIFS